MQSIQPILILALSTSLALAHPGKTDAKGGHTDAKTGIYHLHTPPTPKPPAPKKPAPKKAAPKKAAPKKK